MFLCISCLQNEAKAQPIFDSQRDDPRVVKLQPGKPALVQMPTPNPDNDNSAIILSYQVFSASHCLILSFPYCMLLPSTKHSQTIEMGSAVPSCSRLGERPAGRERGGGEEELVLIYDSFWKPHGCIGSQINCS